MSVQEAGLREGDYIVAVDGQDCKWAKHAEVVHLLKSCSDRGVDIGVVTLHSHDTQVRVRKTVQFYSTSKNVTKTENILIKSHLTQKINIKKTHLFMRSKRNNYNNNNNSIMFAE